MKSSEEIIHAFIIRIWIEPREANDVEPIWRGVIEHVEDKRELREDEKPVYFDHLDKMNTYFANYLGKIGVRIELRK